MGLSNKKFLLTGGTGFIGSNLITRLKSEGADIINIGRTRVEGITNINIDLLKENNLDPLKEISPDYFIHLAAFSSPRRVNSEASALELNVNSAKKILKNINSKNLRKTILFSSCVVYNPSDLPLNEFSELTNRPNAYVNSKLALEDLTSELNKEGCSTITFRLSNTYGPGQQWKKEDAPTLMPQLMSQSILEKRMVLWDPRPVRDYIYVDDVCEAIIKSLDSNYKGIVNIGSGKGTRVGEVARIIKKISSASIDISKKSEVKPTKIVLDISRAKDVLNWEPQTGICEGIKKTYSYYLRILK